MDSWPIIDFKVKLPKVRHLAELLKPIAHSFVVLAWIVHSHNYDPILNINHLVLS